MIEKNYEVSQLNTNGLNKWEDYIKVEEILFQTQNINKLFYTGVGGDWRCGNFIDCNS